MSAALRFFCKAGFVDVALSLYRSRHELGIDSGRATFDDLLRALCADGDSDSAYNVIEDSMQRPLPRSPGIFSPWPMHYAVGDESLPLLMEQWKLDWVRVLLDATVKQEIRPGADILAWYLTALFKVGNLTEACLVPHNGTHNTVAMERIYKHKTTWKSSVCAFAPLELVDALPRLLIETQKMGHIPSRHLSRIVIISLCKAERYRDVLGLLSQQLQRREIFNKMVRVGVEPNWESEMFLLQGYLKSNKISDAIIFFRFLHRRKEHTSKFYNVMITGHCQAGRPDQAVHFWKEAREKKLIPSLQSYEELALALGSVKDYNTLVKLLDDFRETGCHVSVFLCNVVLMHTLKSQDLLRVWFKLREESKEKDSCEAEMNELPGNQSAGRLLLGQLIAAFSGGIHTRENLDKVVQEFEKYFPVDLYTQHAAEGICHGREDGPCT